MKRLFTFGCSFTHYHWPTWADLVGREFDVFENWGSGGTGNLFIHNQLNVCSLKNNFAKGDTVIVQWTNVTRNDVFRDGEWDGQGNIYSAIKRPDARTFDEEGFFRRDLAFIHSARILLDHLGVDYYFLSMVPITNFDQNYVTDDMTPRNTNLARLYSPTLELIRPSIYEVVFDKNWMSRSLLPIDYDKKIHARRNRFDFHASTMEHLEYIDQVLPEIPISDATRQWAQEVQAHITQPARGADCFDISTYRPWVQSFGSLWKWKPTMSDIQQG